MERTKSKLYATARWQQLRKLAFGRSYLCMYCYRAQAKVVDHLGGCTSDNCKENLIPCCKRCHDRKTALIEVVCRLINVQNFSDALHYAARKIKHCYDVPEWVLTEFTPDQLSVYNTLKAHSLYRAVTELDVNVYDIRYVLAVTELHKLEI